MRPPVRLDVRDLTPLFAEMRPEFAGNPETRFRSPPYRHGHGTRHLTPGAGEAPMIPHGETSRATPSMRLTPQLVLGTMVIIAGILLTLDNLHIIEASQYIRFWPSGIIAFGLLKLSQTRDRDGGGFTGAIFVLVGSWLLLEQTTVVRLSIWELWPTLLVFLGGFHVWQSLTGPRVKSLPLPTPPSDANAVITGTAVLGGVVRGNNSPNFRGG